ncbi:hypothetical protein JB92DRAFT_3045537 [Gautieria morchelliformis]|nr:hypothetical protein JB92DRAFT_3045537 [Gautieria morchelliformis]
MRYRAAAHLGTSPRLERTSPSFASHSAQPSDREVPELPLDTDTPGPSARALPEHAFESTPTNHTLSPLSALSFHADPSLTLPRMLASTSSAPGAPPARQSASPGSPWSRDDQTAASLLLNISSRHSRSGSASNEEKAQDADMLSHSATGSRRHVRLSAQTPSSLLGMADDSAAES